MSLLKKLIIVASVAGLVACGDEDSGKSYLRILHASPDAPAVDIYVNNELQLSDIEYQDGTGYLRLPDGNATVELRQAGTDTVVATHVGTLDTDGYYAAIAVNPVASLDIRVIDETDVVTDGTQDLRVFHAASGADAVDVYITAPDAELGVPSLDNVSYLSNAVVPDVADGKYQVRVTGEGSKDIIYDTGSLSINDELMVVAVGSTQGASSISLLIWGGASATPVLDNTSELRIVHAVDSIAVDIYGNEQLIDENIAYTTALDYQVVTAGDYDLAITGTGAAIGDAPPGLNRELTLERGQSYTVIATGSSDSIEDATIIFATDNRKPEDSSSGYIRLINAATADVVNAADVKIYDVAGGYTEPTESEESSGTSTEQGDIKVTGISQGDITSYFPRDPDAYTIDISSAGTETPVVVPGLANVEVAAGDLKTFVIVGKSSPMSAPVELSDKRAE